MSEMKEKVQQLVAEAVGNVREFLTDQCESELLEDLDLIEAHHAWYADSLAAANERADKAEQENARLREGIEEVRVGCLQAAGNWNSESGVELASAARELAALLAQPSRSPTMRELIDRDDAIEAVYARMKSMWGVKDRFLQTFWAAAETALRSLPAAEKGEGDRFSRFHKAMRRMAKEQTEQEPMAFYCRVVQAMDEFDHDTSGDAAEST